ncbi:MAG: hypothetical protein U0263_40920 [Polyangiaceae bacterium]
MAGDAGFLGANASQLATIQTEEAAGPFLQSYPLFAKVDFLPKSSGTVQSFQRFFTVLAEQAKGPAGLTEPLPSLLGDHANRTASATPALLRCSSTA